MKFWKLTPLLFTLLPMFCSGEMKGTADVTPILTRITRVEDKNEVAKFDLVGAKIETEMYSTKTPNIRFEGSITKQLGKKSENSREFINVGYMFYPANNFSIKPYMGISHQCIKNKYTIFYDLQQINDSRVTNNIYFTEFGSKFFYLINDEFNLCMNLNIGFGNERESVNLPYGIGASGPHIYKQSLAKAEYDIALNYFLREGMYIIGKIGSDAFLTRNNCGHLETYGSLGMKFVF